MSIITPPKQMNRRSLSQIPNPPASTKAPSTPLRQGGRAGKNAMNRRNCHGSHVFARIRFFPSRVQTGVGAYYSLSPTVYGLAGVGSPLTISSAGSLQGNPSAFDITVPLTTPFHYDPAAGNLLLQVQNYSGAASRSSPEFPGWQPQLSLLIPESVRTIFCQ